MATDNTLQFTTRVDLSGLESGFEEAQSAVEDFGGTIAEKMEIAQQATKNLAEAQVQLGAAAERGSAKAASILRDYQTAVTQANQAVAQASAVTDTAASSSRNLAEANAAVVVSQEAVARSSAHEVTALQATSGTIRELTGALPIRAVENFISKTLGLGTIIQAAFPVVGAIALGEVVVDLGRKLYDAFDLGGERARKFQEDLVDVQSRVEEVQANLDVKLQRLVAQKDKLEGRAATNGLALELAESTQRALELDKVLDQINKDREKALHDNAPSLPQRLLGTTGTHEESVMLEEHTRHMKEATTAEAQLNEQKSYGTALQQKLNELNTAQDLANQLAAGGGMVVSYQKQIDAIQQLIKWKQEDQKTIETTQKVDAVQDDVNKLRGDKLPKGPQINRIQLLIEEQNQEKQIYAQFHEYLQTLMLDDFRAQDQAYKQTEQADRERTAIFKKNREDEANAAREAADETHNVNLGGIETAQTSSANKNALSLVQDPQGQLQALRNFHQQADAENERYYAEEIRIATGADELQRVTQLENKLGEVRRAANIRQLNDEKNIQLQIAQVQQQSLTKFEGDIANTFAKSITTQESWAQNSIKLYESVANSFITNLAKMGAQELVALALHKSVESQKILADAKGAAANSYDWASAWGGPIAGAIAGAAAFAGVLAFDSFEYGGIVNGPNGAPVPIMAHAGERVLTAGQTNKFESMVNNGGSSSANVNLHYNPQINGIDKAGMRAILQSHADDIHSIVRSGVRSGAIGSRG